jgi:hypothetical protein
MDKEADERNLFHLFKYNTDNRRERDGKKRKFDISSYSLAWCY